MRFAEPFALKEGLSAEEKLESERLMFMELTQSQLMMFSPPALFGMLMHGTHRSLPLGKFDGPLTAHQHDRRPDQVSAVYRR